MQPEPPQLIGHTAWGELVDGLGEQCGQIGAQVAVGKSDRQQIEKQRSIPDSLYHRVGEAESRSPLLIHDTRKTELLEGLFGENAVMRDALRLEKATVGLEADLA